MKKEKLYIWPYSLTASALFIVAAVVLVPVANAVLMSLQSYDLRRPREIVFIGLANYIEVFHDPIFQGSLLRTALWVIFGVGFQFLFGFILANFLNKSFKGHGIIRSVGLIPWVTPGVLIGLMQRWIYDGNYGVLSSLLKEVGLIDMPIPFLAQGSTVMPSAIATITWQGIPSFTLMLPAGLQGVPVELHEVVGIDSANGAQKLFRITIPSIKNTIFVIALPRTIWATNSVDVIFSVTGGGPAYVSQTLSVYIFNKANSLNLRYSSTMSLLLTLLLLVVTVPYLKSMSGNQEG